MICSAGQLQWGRINLHHTGTFCTTSVNAGENLSRIVQVSKAICNNLSHLRRLTINVNLFDEIAPIFEAWRDRQIPNFTHLEISCHNNSEPEKEIATKTVLASWKTILGCCFSIWPTPLHVGFLDNYMAYDNFQVLDWLSELLQDDWNGDEYDDQDYDSDDYDDLDDSDYSCIGSEEVEVWLLSQQDGFGIDL